MDLFDTTQLALGKAMEGSALRQSALADNLANANTPGYQRKDVNFQAALRDALDSPAGGVRAALQGVSFSAQDAPAGVMTADGNTVDLDVEASDLAQNGLEYEAIVSVMKGRDDILRSAIGTV